MRRRARRKSPAAARGPDQEIAERLHAAAIHLLRRLRRQDEATGLSPARLSALSVVVFAGPVTLGDLAAAEQVRPPTMTRLVKSLEREGLVVRRADPDDGRIVRLQATPKGRRVMERGRRRRIDALVSRFDRLDPAGRRVLEEAAVLMERLARDT